MEATRRASLADKEALHIRALELGAGPSSSRDVERAGGTTDSVVAIRTLLRVSTLHR